MIKKKMLRNFLWLPLTKKMLKEEKNDKKKRKHVILKEVGTLRFKVELNIDTRC